MDSRSRKSLAFKNFDIFARPDLNFPLEKLLEIGKVSANIAHHVHNNVQEIVLLLNKSSGLQRQKLTWERNWL